MNRFESEGSLFDILANIGKSYTRKFRLKVNIPLKMLNILNGTYMLSRKRKMPSAKRASLKSPVREFARRDL